MPEANGQLTAFRSQPFRSLLPPGNVSPLWASVTLILGLLLASVKVVAVSRAGLIAYPYLTGFCSCFAPVKGPGSCLHPQRQELGSHTPPQCHQISPSPDCSHFHPPIHLKASETLSRTIPKAPKDPPCFHWCSANHFSGDWRSCHIFDKNPHSHPFP